MKPRFSTHFLQVVKALALVSSAGSAGPALVGCGLLASEAPSCPAPSCAVDAAAPDASDAAAPISIPVLGTDAAPLEDAASTEVVPDAPYDGMVFGVGPPPPIPPPPGVN